MIENCAAKVFGEHTQRSAWRDLDSIKMYVAVKLLRVMA